MLNVWNRARDVELVRGGRVADTRWTRLKGLIGVRELPAGDGLLIKPCKGVHCMFMSIPIDVIYLDREDRVIGLDASMQPWQIGRIYRQGHSVLEVPVGTVARSGTQIGDQLEVEIAHRKQIVS